MSGFNDLGRALRDDAERHAPRADSFDVDALTRAARAKRTPRLWAATALAAAAVVGIGGVALGLPGLSAPELLAGGASSADESATLESAEDAGAPAGGDGDRERFGSLSCGATIASLQQGAPGADLSLQLDDLSLGSRDATTAVMTGSLLISNDSEAAVRLDDVGSPEFALVDEFGTITATARLEEPIGVGLEVPPGGELTIPFASTVTTCDGETPLLGLAGPSAIAVLSLSSGTLVSTQQSIQPD